MIIMIGKVKKVCNVEIILIFVLCVVFFLVYSWMLNGIIIKNRIFYNYIINFMNCF